ncbi:hypothetical protein D3C72_1075390 [compost metagenome]
MQAFGLALPTHQDRAEDLGPLSVRGMEILRHAGLVVTCQEQVMEEGVCESGGLDRQRLALVLLDGGPWIAGVALEIVGL